MNLAVIASMRHKGIAKALVIQALAVGGTSGGARRARSAGFEPCRACTLPKSWVSRRDDPANVLYQSHRRCVADGTGSDCVGAGTINTRSRLRRRTYQAAAVIS